MKIVISSVCVAGLLFSAPLLARDSVQHYSLQDVMTMPEAQGKLDGSVKFYLAGQKTPRILKRMSSGVSNKKTNSVGKDEEFGCRWAALSALVSFQESAKRLGANAVVDIVSYYKKVETKSPSKYDCHSGNIIAGVTLKGTYANIK